MSASVHRLAAAVLDQPWMVMDDGRPIAWATTLHMATRIAELLDRHGLVDVPDTCEGLAA